MYKIVNLKTLSQNNIMNKTIIKNKIEYLGIIQ